MEQTVSGLTNHSNKERIYTLDIIRLLSVFFIFLFHSNIHLGCTYSILTPFVSQGAIFMVTFFMLSGFSIYYKYGDKDLSKLKDLKKFYIKRIISIYPIYIGAYILVLIFTNPLTIKQNLILAPIEIGLFSCTTIHVQTYYISKRTLCMFWY